MNETDFMTRAEAAEIARRLDAEDARAAHRLAELEETTKQIGALTLSVQSSRTPWNRWPANCRSSRGHWRTSKVGRRRICTRSKSR